MINHKRQLTPDFFICGAARSGTTALWHCLKQHPQLFLPCEYLSKEPAFYCLSNQRFGISSRAEYENLLADAKPGQLVGEASGAYLTSPESPLLIYNDNPLAKFIILLRNPADRAYSLYKWMRTHGYEMAECFQEALMLEKIRVCNATFFHDNPQYFYNYLYFTTGIYINYITNYLRVFGQNQCLFLISEQLFSEPMTVLQVVFRHLGVDPLCDVPFEQVNRSADDFPRLDAELRRHLLERYHYSISELSHLLGLDLHSIWN